MKMLLVSLILLTVVVAGCIKPPEPLKQSKEIPKFSSCTEIKNTFENSANMRGYGMMYDSLAIGGVMKTTAETGTSVPTANISTDYSETNVQVQGVDEADIVKTDGKYIYAISNNNLVIAEAFPAETAEILSKTELNVTPKEIFINKNNVLVFGEAYRDVRETQKETGTMEKSYYPYYSQSVTVIQLIDASDKAKPEIKRTIEFEGSYLNSRKINEQVYFVINSYAYYMQEDPEKIIPLYSDSKTGSEFQEIAECGDIGYLPPINPESFVTIGSVSMDGFDSEIKKETVVGSAQNIFASQENLYLAQTEYEYYIPVVTEMVNAVRTSSGEYTSIHKFSLDNGKISYSGAMQAPGTILNQFSMDEFEGNFRIATTKGHVTRTGGGTTNNIYVFGENLEMQGKLEDLAPGEKIYSARFMGNKGYLVTFKKIDPLFVIDLSDAKNPKVLGKLKIPGYSDYLHPIDETHLIGIGKETIEAEQGDFAWYQGIKIAVFDVSDVENPKEMFKEIIGDRGTDSYALQDHKAFLFDKEKNLLVFPVRLAEISEEQKREYEERQNQGWGSPPYGEFTFQGAYVYNLSLENGFQLKGRITHLAENDDSLMKSGYYYYGAGTEVKRALYIDDVLYTISNNKILANSLENLSLIKTMVMAEKEENNDYYREAI